MMSTVETIGLILRIATSLGQAIFEAINAGDTPTLEALKAVLKDPDELRQMDEALVLAQRAKAAKELT